MAPVVGHPAPAALALFQTKRARSALGNHWLTHHSYACEKAVNCL